MLRAAERPIEGGRISTATRGLRSISLARTWLGGVVEEADAIGWKLQRFHFPLRNLSVRLRPHWARSPIERTEPKKMNSRLALPMVLLIAASACKQSARPAPPSVPVTVAKAEERPVPYHVTAPRTVETIQAVAVSPHGSSIV